MREWKHGVGTVSRRLEGGRSYFDGRSRTRSPACIAAVAAALSCWGCVSHTYFPPPAGGVPIRIRWLGGVGDLTRLVVRQTADDEVGRWIELGWPGTQPQDTSVDFYPGRYAAMQASVARSFSERLAGQACPPTDTDCILRHADHGTTREYGHPGIADVVIQAGHQYELTIDNGRDGWVNVVLYEDGGAVAATHPETVEIRTASGSSGVRPPSGAAVAPANGGTASAPECRMNSDCTLGQFCKDGSCVAECREDRDCASGLVCRAALGQCVTAHAE